MLLQFSTYSFEGVKLPDTWSGTKETRYSDIPIIGRKPTLQRIGESLEEITIGIIFSGENCNPRKELEALDTLRQKSIVSNLVDGSGRNYGKFVITAIDYSPMQCLSNGVPILLSATINFLEYNSQKTITEQKGEALSINTPIPRLKIQQIESPPVSINNKINKGILQSNKITITDNLSVNKLAQINEMASTAKAYFEDALDKIQRTEKLVNRTKQLRDSLSNAIESAGSLADYAKKGEITKLAGAKSTLDSSTSIVKDNSSILAAVIGSREGGLVWTL